MTSVSHTSPPHAIRLNPDHADAFFSLRREMLGESPWAFASSLEDDRFRDLAAVRASLGDPQSALLGVPDPASPGRLLAGAGVVRESKLKRRHVAMIWGVFTRPEARRMGLGRLVMLAAIAEARSWRAPSIDVVSLSVRVRAEVWGGVCAGVGAGVGEEAGPGAALGRSAARRLYESLGFVVWGVEPLALRTESGEMHAEAHMQLRLGDVA